MLKVRNYVLHGGVVPEQAGQYKRQKARERSELANPANAVVRRTHPDWCAGSGQANRDHWQKKRTLI